MIDSTWAQIQPDRKMCSRCKTVKPRAEFTLDNHRCDQLCIYCKQCVREKGREYWAGKIEARKEYQRNWQRMARA